MYSATNYINKITVKKKGRREEREGGCFDPEREGGVVILGVLIIRVEWLPGSKSTSHTLKIEAGHEHEQVWEHKDGKLMQTVPSLTTDGTEPLSDPALSENLKSAWKHLIPRQMSGGSFRCTASNWLEFNYMKNELQLKMEINKVLWYFIHHTPQNTSWIKQQQHGALASFCQKPFFSSPVCL